MKKVALVLAAIAFYFAFRVLVGATVEWAVASATGDEGIARAAAPIGTGIALIIALVLGWRLKALRDSRRRQRGTTAGADGQLTPRPEAYSSAKVNRRQRRVIWGAIALLFLALFIPPWYTPQLRGGTFDRYAFLFSAEAHYGEKPAVLIEHSASTQVFVGLLLAEALLVALATAGAVIALAGGRPAN